MPDGRVSYRRVGRYHVLRYTGRVQYTLAPAIERHLDAIVAEVTAGDLIFDLRDATMLDSTNLGLMARVAARADRGDGHHCTIVLGNEDVSQVLRSMCFPEIFDLVTDHPVADEPGDEQPIAQTPTSQVELLRTMLEAHRVLAAMDESDPSFRAVVAQLEAEMAMTTAVDGEPRARSH